MTPLAVPFAELIHRLPPIGLVQLNEVAELQNRHDAKFLVPVASLDVLLNEVAGQMKVLDVDNERQVRYRSVYFDTPDRAFYRAHVQRRRRRYKVRIRRYGQTPTAVLELKLKGLRGRTEKHRWPVEGVGSEQLDTHGRVLVGEALAAAYGWDLPDDLTESLRTEFLRTTLVDPIAGERVTIDLGFGVTDRERKMQFDPATAVVECKTATLHGPILHAMVRLGHRPENISKYCMGIVATDPPLAGNDWFPALRVLQPTGTPTSDPSNCSTC